MKEIYYICRERQLIKTPEYSEFLESVNHKVQEKIDYVTDILIQRPAVNAKFVKKLENTDFYEMRLSVNGNEYRVLLYPVDHPNIIQATQVILLNGFMTKDTKEYKAQIATANNIIKRLSENDESNN